MEKEHDDELQHHGVKGQKWGKRKDRTRKKKLTLDDFDDETKAKLKTTLENKSSSGKTKVNNRFRSVNRRKLSKMSNDEIKELVDRMNLENQALMARNNLVNNSVSPKVRKGIAKTITEAKDKIVVPAVQESGRQILKEMIVNAAHSAMAKNK